MSGKNLIEIDNIDICFYKRKGFFKKPQEMRAITGMSMNIQEGEIVALVGESGCGKTTLGKAVCGLIEPQKGMIRYDGVPLNEMSKQQRSDYRRGVQMVQQDSYAALNPVRTIYQSLSGPILGKGIVSSQHDARKKVAELLSKVELNPPELFFEKYPHQLSGGQRQRILMARAISLNPRLIVADEPVSMIDVSLRISILNLMSKLNRELGIAFIYITHDLATARYIAQNGKIAVMYLGKLVEYGDILEVIKNPQHPYLKVLLSAVPVPDPEVAKNMRRQPLKSIDMPSIAKLPPGCPFNPRCIFASGLCERDNPALELSEGAQVACHHRAELEERRAAYTGAVV